MSLHPCLQYLELIFRVPFTIRARVGVLSNLLYGIVYSVYLVDTDREIDRNTQIERQRDREERQRDRETERQRDRERQKE